MDWDDYIMGNWHELAGKIKIQWAKITDDEMLEIEGKREALCAKLQKHYGHSKEEAEEHIDDFLASI